jgi:hypothetical protein
MGRRDLGWIMRRRRGTAYIMVVAIAGLAGVTALSAMFILAGQRRIIELQAGAGAARGLAMSAIERAAAMIEADENWRWNQPGGVWVDAAALGGGHYTIEVIDPVDRDFSDNEGDPVRISASATVGSATQFVTATLQPERDRTESLKWGVFTAGDISVALLAGVSASTDVRAGGSVSSNLGNVWARVVATGSVSGLTYLGGTVQGAGPVAAPDPALIDEYVSRGTRIDFSALNSGALERVVLSPEVNPFGPPAGAAGIYYIDCGNQTITVRRLRVLGTLVLLNPGSGSRIRDTVRFDPAAEGYPSVLVRGNIEFDTSTSALSESSESVNFNPPGAPFTGVTDGDRTDSYPTRFTGLVYTTGDVTIKGTLRASAPLLVGGRLTVSGSLDSSYVDGDISLAPPGFGGALRLVVDEEGVWRGVQ